MTTLLIAAATTATFPSPTNTPESVIAPGLAFNATPGTSPPSPAPPSTNGRPGPADAAAQPSSPETYRDIVQDAVGFAAGLALGPAGSACCQFLTIRHEWASAWLAVQRRVLEALRLVAPAARPPLLPLWMSLKGIAGLRSPSADVRAAAADLVGEAVALAPGQHPHTALATSVASASVSSSSVNLGSASSACVASEPSAASAPASACGDVSPWAVCRELCSCLAGGENDPRVLAAYLRQASRLLELCAGGCSARDWRRVVEGVLLAAGSGAGSDRQVWSEALALARVHTVRPGWRHAVRELEGELLRTAQADEGPAATYGAGKVIRMVAGASALDAALGPVSSRLAAGDVAAEEGGLERSSGEDVTRLLTALAVCLGDVLRGEMQTRGPPGEPGVWQRLLAGELLTGAGQASFGSPPAESSPVLPAAAMLRTSGTRLQEGSGDTDAPEAEVEDAGGKDMPALAMAAAVQAACRNLGLVLSSDCSLEALEALVHRAETAPLIQKPPAERGAGPSAAGSPGASRVALLAALGATATGALAALRRATGAAERDDPQGVAGTVASRAAAGAGNVHSAVPQRLQGAAAAVPSVEQLAAAMRVVRLIRRVAALVQQPDKLLFSEVGGGPMAPTDNATAAAARQHHLAVAAGAEAVKSLLGALPAPLVVATGGGGREAGGDDHQVSEGVGAAGPGHEPGTRGGTRRPQVIIEELPSSPTHASAASTSAAATASLLDWRAEQQALVSQLVLLCATYAHPCPRPPPVTPAAPLGAPGTDGSASSAADPGKASYRGACGAVGRADPGLPPPPRDVFTPWSDPGGAAAACEALLTRLCSLARPHPPPSRALRAAGSGAGSLALLSEEELSEQELLAACLPGLVKDHVRPIVVQRHVQDLEEGPIRPYTGPDAFTRAVAARRLAWLLMRSRHPFVAEALCQSLPALLACCDDPAVGVTQYGVAGLHAVAAECLSADLQWQRELFMEQARRMVVGCHEQVWPLVCPAAVALVRRIEGREPRADGYHRLTQDLLTEMERQAHVAPRRLAFMPACTHLVACLGLTTLRHLARLMPLLLEWLHAHDRPTRVAALGLLGALVRATWPRVGAHAGVLWQHMLAVLVRAESAEDSGDTGAGVEGPEERQAEVQGAREVCELLLACARGQVEACQPAAAGWPPGAERLHQRFLSGVYGLVGT